ncbi:MAG: hypothetical protein HRU09_10995 [Oligoflexales bacterium]|nr:hypothetical protein [Oligoflexales bacterium]
MRFQSVMLVVMSFSVFASSAFSKEAKKAKQQHMYVQCQYDNLLTGGTDYQWAVDQHQKYVEVSGVKNSDDEFVAKQNEQLVKDYCTYTKRAHYGDDRIEFYADAGMVASPKGMFGKSVPLVFESELKYPEKVDPDWAQKLTPGKVKSKKSIRNFYTKTAIAVAGFVGLGIATWFNAGEKALTWLEKGTLTLGASLTVGNFIVSDLDWSQAEKALEKVGKAGDKFKPKKPDTFKKLQTEVLERQKKDLDDTLAKKGISLGPEAS